MRKTLKISLLAGFAAAQLLAGTAASASRGADDPAGHVRQCRGCDDVAPRQARGADDAAAPAGARRADDAAGDVRRSRGADDAPGDVRRGRGADDPAGHVRGGNDDGPNHT